MPLTSVQGALCPNTSLGLFANCCTCLYLHLREKLRKQQLLWPGQQPLHIQWEMTSAILCLCSCNTEQRGPQGFAGLLLNTPIISVAATDDRALPLFV